MTLMMMMMNSFFFRTRQSTELTSTLDQTTGEIKFSCVYKGFPVPEVTWSFNGVSVEKI